METKEIVHVVFDERWTIQYRGQYYGQYTSKEDAAFTARQWAENAATQGHAVQVVIHSLNSPAFSLFNIDPLRRPAKERAAA